MNYRFQHIEYLIAGALIPVLLLLFWLVLRWKKKTAKKIGDERLVKEITRHYAPQRYAWKFVLVILAFAASVLALANPRTPSGSEKVSRNGIDVMIALDVSKSMLARDVQPSRLERAKQVVNKLIDKLSNDRIGLVVFAGKAYLQMPLTGDHSAAKMYLSSASPEAVPTQGTVLGDALKMSFAAFNTKEKKYKAVVLISDGEDHDEGALTVAGQMADEGILINTVGVGSPEGTTIMDETTNEVKKDNEGNVVVTRLNEKELMNISEKGNGIYQRLGNTDDVVAKLDAQLNTMDQRTVTEDSLLNYYNYFSWLLGLALVLLVLESVISERRKLKNRQVAANMKPALALGLAFLVPFFGKAQNEKSIIKEGNAAYEKKDYQGAVDNYKKVTTKTESNSTAQYNLGNALYRNSKPDDAVVAYDNATKYDNSAAGRARAFYNKGVVLQNNKKIPECIDAYKQALKLNPQDEDARQNLQKALIQQQQQQKKEEKNDKKDQKKDKKQQDQQKKQQDQDQQQQKPPPSKISKQDAEEKLKALLQEEKNLQDRMKRMNTGSSAKPDKDW